MMNNYCPALLHVRIAKKIIIVRSGLIDYFFYAGQIYILYLFIYYVNKSFILCADRIVIFIVTGKRSIL